MRAHIAATIRLFSTLIPVAVLLLGGPVSVAAAPEPLVATVQGVQDDFRYARLQAEATQAALDELSITDVADLDQAYREFAGWVDRMQETGKRLLVHADQMHFNGASYLVESGQTPSACAFPRLRVPRDTREAQLGELFDDIAAESWKVKRAYRAYEFDIVQIRNFLRSTRSPKGVETIKLMIRKARVDGASLQEALARAQAAVERAKMAKGNAPPAAPS